MNHRHQGRPPLDMLNHRHQGRPRLDMLNHRHQGRPRLDVFNHRHEGRPLLDILNLRRQQGSALDRRNHRYKGFLGCPSTPLSVGTNSSEKSPTLGGRPAGAPRGSAPPRTAGPAGPSVTPVVQGGYFFLNFRLFLWDL